MPCCWTVARQAPLSMGFPRQEYWSGCHFLFLLQCMKVKSESEVAQSCPTPSDPMDCPPTGSSVHGIFQARVLEWGAIACSPLKALPGAAACGSCEWRGAGFSLGGLICVAVHPDRRARCIIYAYSPLAAILNYSSLSSVFPHGPGAEVSAEENN